MSYKDAVALTREIVTEKNELLDSMCVAALYFEKKYTIKSAGFEASIEKFRKVSVLPEYSMVQTGKDGVLMNIRDTLTKMWN